MNKHGVMHKQKHPSNKVSLLELKGSNSNKYSLTQ